MQRVFLLLLIYCLAFCQLPLYEIVENTGVNFINSVTSTKEVNGLNDYYFYSSGGVALADLNNDGLVDIILTSGQKGGKIYKNLGNLKFADVTDESGAFKNPEVWRDGITVVDINNDGLLDFYVCTRHGASNELYINKGNFKFVEKAKDYGIDYDGASIQATFFDYDNDGDLDLYLANTSAVSSLYSTTPQGTITKTLKNSNDLFFINENGKFVEKTFELWFDWTNKATQKNALSVLAFDFDNDNKTEIFVANDFTMPDFYYKITPDSKVENIHHKVFKQTSLYSMGSDAQDINNDGYLDIIVVDMAPEDPVRSKRLMSGMNPEGFWETVKKYNSYQYMYNAFHLNNRNGTFSNINFYSHTAKTDWSWSPLLLDFDNDGNIDLFVSNGIRKDITDNDFFKIILPRYLKSLGKDVLLQLTEEEIKHIIDSMPEQPLYNYFFLQTEKYKFKKLTKEIKHRPSFSIGAAYADLDNDGDLEIVVNNLDDIPFIYKNNAQELYNNNFVKILLKNLRSKNTYCIGAKVWLITDKKIYYTQVNPTRGYESSSDYTIHFGLGKANPEKIIVQWAPENIKEYPVKVNSLNIITPKSKGKNSKPPIKYEKNKYFYDATDKIIPKYIHKENKYDDYKHQVLLPHKMSELGPALAVADVNGDGLEDFFIGSAKDFTPALYIQNKNGTFTKKEIPDFEKTKEYEDIDATFLDIDNDGDKDLYVVSGGYEQPSIYLYKDRIYINENGNFIYDTTRLPDIYVSGGCVVPEDIDNDGDIDLFIGGRQQPKHYPYPANSYILENNNGKFSIKQVFNQLGMITSAVFVDLNNDGYKDLITAGEWTPIIIFYNNNGKFINMTKIPDTEGWWNNLATADLDNDGDLDIIALNLGLNHKYHASPQHPFHIYSNDFDNNQKTDIVLAYEYKNKQLPVRGRECSSQQLQFIAEKFPTYTQFASATIFDIYGEPIKKSLHFIAKNFANVILQNKGNGNFEIHKLPPEAQFSTLHGVNILDVNNDGKKDIILFGNFYCFEVETPRSDAFQGLLLLNNGNLSFSPVWATEAGIFNWKDARKSKLIHVNNKPAILVPNNQDELKLFIKK